MSKKWVKHGLDGQTFMVCFCLQVPVYGMWLPEDNARHVDKTRHLKNTTFIISVCFFSFFLQIWTKLGNSR